MHAGTFESSSDGNFATCLDNPGRGTEAQRMETWIAHAVPVAAKVVVTFSSLVGRFQKRTYRTQDDREFTFVQFGVSFFSPRFGLGRIT